jgi:hypothetical protein
VTCCAFMPWCRSPLTARTASEQGPAPSCHHKTECPTEMQRLEWQAQQWRKTHHESNGSGVADSSADEEALRVLRLEVRCASAPKRPLFAASPVCVHHPVGQCAALALLSYHKHPTTPVPTEQRDGLRAEHQRRLAAHHAHFHPVWGQVLKTGYQNSRYAHQVRSGMQDALVESMSMKCILNSCGGWGKEDVELAIGFHSWRMQ